MTTGRPNKPIELKRLTGTLRQDRLPNAPVAINNRPTPPVAPQTLENAGQVFWETVWESNWVSQSSDYHLALITAETLDERERIKTALLDTPSDRRLRTSLRELDKQLLTSLALLGFTPSDRSRLGIIEVKTESKLEDLLRRRASAKYPNSITP